MPRNRPPLYHEGWVRHGGVSGSGGDPRESPPAPAHRRQRVATYSRASAVLSRRVALLSRTYKSASPLLPRTNAGPFPGTTSTRHTVPAGCFSKEMCALDAAVGPRTLSRRPLSQRANPSWSCFLPRVLKSVSIPKTSPSSATPMIWYLDPSQIDQPRHPLRLGSRRPVDPVPAAPLAGVSGRRWTVVINERCLRIGDVGGLLELGGPLDKSVRRGQVPGERRPHDSCGFNKLRHDGANS